MGTAVPLERNSFSVRGPRPTAAPHAHASRTGRRPGPSTRRATAGPGGPVEAKGREAAEEQPGRARLGNRAVGEPLHVRERAPFADQAAGGAVDLVEPSADSIERALHEDEPEDRASAHVADVGPDATRDEARQTIGLREHARRPPQHAGVVEGEIAGRRQTVRQRAHGGGDPRGRIDREQVARAATRRVERPVRVEGERVHRLGGLEGPADVRGDPGGLVDAVEIAEADPVENPRGIVGDVGQGPRDARDRRDLRLQQRVGIEISDEVAVGRRVPEGDRRCARDRAR